jgi:hypothetical protein
MNEFDFSTADKAFSAFFKTLNVLHEALVPRGHISKDLAFYVKIKQRVRRLLKIWNMGERERIKMINILGTTKSSPDKPQSFDDWTSWVSKEFVKSDFKKLSIYVKEFDQ